MRRTPFNPSRYGNRKQTPETHLRRQALTFLRLKGHIAGKVNVIGTPLKGGGFIASPDLMRGLPDIFSFAPDRTMYAIECKVGRNVLSSYQREFQHNFHNPPSRIYLIIYLLEDLERIIK